jgi:pyruvate,water dikinase
VGGKGASLASLAAAGFPVPPGFQVTTAAYRRFVSENHLQRIIDGELVAVAAGTPDALERAANAIRAAFERGVISPDIAAAIGRAYANLGKPGPAVAVRSSATAEDLPGLSFAGQQETFLNVQGEADLLAAVQGCWASLWTPRAIAYRQQMGVPTDGVAMAVVVQEMAPAEISGVLFTANPATGQRGEMVIEATRGLGEGLVGGTVTPDSLVIDRQTLTETSSSAASTRGPLLLPEPMVRDLVQLGERVEEHAGGVPQDIEWAVAGGRLWLLQARPITNLPDAPLAVVRWESPEAGATWVRRQVVEHMPEPLSPLFAELYLKIGLDASIKAATAAMGMGDLFARLFDGPFFTTVNGYGYSRGNFALTRQTAPLLARAMFVGPRWLFRQGVEHWRDDGLPAYLATIARWQDVDPAIASDAALLRGVRELTTADAVYWFAAAIAIGTAKVSDWILDGTLQVLAPDRGLHSGLFLRGFPSKTLEAEADLDAIARRVRASDELREVVVAAPAEGLLDTLPRTPEGEQLRRDLDRYFARYGHQIYNLDFVAPTLIEAPLPVLLGLKALVREPGTSALERQAQVARERDRVTEETAESFDPVRRFVFRHMVRWAQKYAPYREDALFYVGAAWPMVRRFAHELGRRLTEAGTLDAADDIYSLESGEIEEAIAARAAGEERSDLARLAGDRRALRERQKRLHPPAAVPPTSGMRIGRFDFSERETQRRNDPNATTLRGFAVSPGRVTAPVSVILSPADFAQMEPGTILVCPTTTPAWTPLFAQARGLVTDIGGILAHGSIVAREYGIPAVMGTGNATQRIANGQQITVDGTAGTVTLGVD